MTDDPTLAYARAHDTLDFLVGMVEAEALSRRTARRAGADVPVVIVTGFLGAGKTTLMRRLLTAGHGLRITALVNDVADLEIDAALVSDVSGDTLSLANGCVCCSQAGGAARALVEIAGRAARPDTILLELSGVADPWSLAQVADAVSGVRTDAVVTVVDAAEPAPAAVAYLFARQLAAADLVLLNKTDLVPRAEADAAAARIARLAPRAQVLRTVDCAVPPAVVFDALRSRASWDQAAASDTTDALVATFTLAAAAPMERRRLEDCLAHLPDGVLRIKGFLRLADAPDRPELLQAVARRWRWQQAPAGAAAGRLAVIALAGAVDAAALEAHFAHAGLIVAD